MGKTWLQLVLGCLLAISLIIAGCGGGGGGSDQPGPVPPVQKSTLTGTASEGALIKNGTVRLKDALGQLVGTTTTDLYGRYSFDVSGLTAPFVVFASVDGRTYISYSAGAGTANINPVTTMVLSLATGITDILALFDGLTDSNVEQMRDRFQEKADEVTTALQALMPKGKGAGNYFTELIVESSGVDAVFDDYLFVVDAVQGFRIFSKTTDKEIWSVPANYVAQDTELPVISEDDVDKKPEEPVDPTPPSDKGSIDINWSLPEQPKDPDPPQPPGPPVPDPNDNGTINVTW